MGAIRAAGTVDLYSSPALIEEFADVIERPECLRQLALIGRTASEVLADYASIVQIVVPKPIDPVARDPDDDDVLACAVAAHADFVVTGDGDLLTLEQYRSIPIVTAAEVREHVGRASPKV
jgi:putative PIN family toxin of toxin-antitoxin system